MSNYPAGAARDPNAPYNNDDPDISTNSSDILLAVQGLFDDGWDEAEAQFKHAERPSDDEIISQFDKCWAEVMKNADLIAQKRYLDIHQGFAG